jgi:hypothetical protein
MPKSRKRNPKHRKSKRRSNPLALAGLFEGLVEQAYSGSMPDVLYHYTTMKGAEGILSSRRFWASTHECTNDNAELVSADSVIKEVGQTLRKTATGTAAAVLDLFLDRYERLHVTQVMNVCLACFSLAKDDRDQWVKYGADGRGVCLGIRVLNEPGPQIYPSRLVAVDYSESSWRETLKANFEPICSVLGRAKNSRENRELGVSALSRIAAFASIMAKQEQWAGEKEVRYVTLIVDENTASQIKEREIAGEKRRYLEVPVRAEGKRISLAEVIIGPNQDPETARVWLTALLMTTGYEPRNDEYPTITISTLPPWSTTNIEKEA